MMLEKASSRSESCEADRKPFVLDRVQVNAELHTKGPRTGEQILLIAQDRHLLLISKLEHLAT